MVNIGRGDYNDVVIADPSVSTMHAKLQRREAIWILTDLGSTNGTFVEGERLTGEVPLSPGTTIRFGDVSALFEPLDETVAPERPKRTQMMPRIEVEPAKVSEEKPVPPSSRRPGRRNPQSTLPRSAPGRDARFAWLRRSRRALPP